MLFSHYPRKKLPKAIAEQRLDMPDHTNGDGRGRRICDPALARQVGEQLNIPVAILPDEGHMLEPSVSKALRRVLLPKGTVRNLTKEI